MASQKVNKDKQQRKEASLKQATLIATYVLMNGGLVLLVRYGILTFVCPLSALLSNNSLDTTLCMSVSQMDLSTFLSVVRANASQFVGFTGLLIGIEQGAWHLSKSIRAARLTAQKEDNT